MEHAKIRCWNKTHRKMKWKLALRIATSPSEGWLKKAAEWNPERSVGQRNDGKMTSMISANKTLTKERLRNHLKERIKTTTPGSILPVAVKSKVNADSNDQEVSDGFSNEGNIWSTIYLLFERTKFGTNSRCDCCTAVSRHPPPWCPCSSWSPGFPLWLPGSLCSSCSVCGVAPNLRIQ